MTEDMLGNLDNGWATSIQLDDLLQNAAITEILLQDVDHTLGCSLCEFTATKDTELHPHAFDHHIDDSPYEYVFQKKIL